MKWLRLGIWRNLGYVYAALNIVGGFVFIGIGASLSTQQASIGTGLFANVFNQIGGLAFVYGGLNGILIGILLIWGLVKSGQIENIDKNIKIIAEWAKLQLKQEPSSDYNLEDEQKKLDVDEKYLAELEEKKKKMDKLDNDKFDPTKKSGE